MKLSFPELRYETVFEGILGGSHPKAVLGRQHGRQVADHDKLLVIVVVVVIVIIVIIFTIVAIVVVSDVDVVVYLMI